MKKRKVLLVFTLLVLLIVCTFFLFVPLRQAIVFQPRDSSLPFAYIPIKEETKFKIKFTHSVHLTDVVESYKILDDQSIQQYELMYENFSIGMPSNAEPGETFEQIGDKYYIKNMKRIFPDFSLRIGKIRANHRVIYMNKEYSLSTSIKPGTVVKVEFRKLNLYQQWKGVNILESL